MRIKAIWNHSQLVIVLKIHYLTIQKIPQHHMPNRDVVFLLASFQMQTHSPRLSPLPSAMLKAHPPPTLHFLSLAVLPPLYVPLILSFITEHFKPRNLLQLFSQTTFLFIPTKSPPLDPLDSAPPPFKPLSPSHSQSDHA